MSPTWDVAIAGAGPAGAAAAATLARSGARVLLLHAPAAPPVAGESLPAAAGPLLRDVGLAGALGPAHRRCLGNLSCWGEETLSVLDALRDPLGPGWHLDRTAFDEALRAGAAALGATVVKARARTVARAGPRFLLGTEHGVFTAAKVMDATGRAARIARALGAIREHAEDLVALVAFTQAAAPDPDHRTLVEAVLEGWWYLAPLPTGAHVVTLHLDAAEAKAVLRTPDAFADRLSRTLHVRARLMWRALAAPPRGAHAGTSRLTAPGGTGWVAVGDAVQCFDPIGAQGIFHALWSGLRGAEALLSGDLRAYARQLAGVWTAHARQRRLAYTSERRWPDAPFWRARAGSGSPYEPPARSPAT